MKVLWYWGHYCSSTVQYFKDEINVNDSLESKHHWQPPPTESFWIGSKLSISTFNCFEPHWSFNIAECKPRLDTNFTWCKLNIFVLRFISCIYNALQVIQFRNSKFDANLRKRNFPARFSHMQIHNKFACPISQLIAGFFVRVQNQ